MDLVIDASVIVKWFLQEENSNRALQVRDDFVVGDVTLHAPWHTPLEVLNALRYSSLCTEERCIQAHLALDGYGLRYHPLAGEVGRRAVHLAYAKALSLCDAAYLALARELGVQVLTADATLLEAGGVDALPLRDYASPAGR